MLDITGLIAPFPGVFIRAPGAMRTWGGCRALSSVGEYIVMAEQENCMALAFHPELTGDTRIHELFLQKVLDRQRVSVEDG
jgi:5'-phosphate synthase pdxT subunit